MAECLGAELRDCRILPTMAPNGDGLQALRKSGLFVTRQAAEITSLRELNLELECCAGWRPSIVYHKEQPFETLYEAGIVSEGVELKLESNRRDLHEARWKGNWIYRYKGREGTGEGVSPAVLKYRKGDETADLVIGTARLSSAGRFNFPANLSGDHRTPEIGGTALSPEALLPPETLPLTGCREEDKNPK
jgi:hypothetical protein